MHHDYPKFRVKIIIETEYQVSDTHQCRVEHIESLMNFLTEIDAVKSAIDSLRKRYYELERDEV